MYHNWFWNKQRGAIFSVCRSNNSTKRMRSNNQPEFCQQLVYGYKKCVVRVQLAKGHLTRLSWVGRDCFCNCIKAFLQTLCLLGNTFISFCKGYYTSELQTVTIFQPLMQTLIGTASLLFSCSADFWNIQLKPEKTLPCKKTKTKKKNLCLLVWSDLTF